MPAVVRAASQRFGVLLICSAANVASLRVWKVFAPLDNVWLQLGVGRMFGRITPREFKFPAPRASSSYGSTKG